MLTISNKILNYLGEGNLREVDYEVSKSKITLGIKRVQAKDEPYIPMKTYGYIRQKVSADNNEIATYEERSLSYKQNPLATLCNFDRMRDWLSRAKPVIYVANDYSDDMKILKKHITRYDESGKNAKYESYTYEYSGEKLSKIIHSYIDPEMIRKEKSVVSDVETREYTYEKGMICESCYREVIRESKQTNEYSMTKSFKSRSDILPYKFNGFIVKFVTETTSSKPDIHKYFYVENLHVMLENPTALDQYFVIDSESQTIKEYLTEFRDIKTPNEVRRIPLQRINVYQVPMHLIHQLLMGE